MWVKRLNENDAATATPDAVRALKRRRSILPKRRRSMPIIVRTIRDGVHGRGDCVGNGAQTRAQQVAHPTATETKFLQKPVG